MSRSVRTKSRPLILVAALLGVSLALAAVVLSFNLVPDFRKIPLLQEIRLMVYRITEPAEIETRDNGAPARDIVLHNPMGLAEDGDGNLYVADRGRWFGLAGVWKINRDGTARLVVGSGHRGPVETGSDALQSDLGSPEGLSLDATGRLYFADFRNHVVVRVDDDGRITKLAGTGKAGFGGDGGPAVDAALDLPYDVRLDSRGNVYVADYGNDRVRMIAPDGTIRTVAGTGEKGYGGDGGPATDAQLNGPYGIFVDGQDALWIADTYNHVVRRVDGDGKIATIIGSGRQGYSGDGGPATAAELDGPQALFVDADGRIFVGDEHNHAVRMVSAKGDISAVIGSGSAGFAADGSPARGAALNDPEYLLVRDDGSLVISDRGNGRVIAIDADGEVRTLAGRKSSGK